MYEAPVINDYAPGCLNSVFMQNRAATEYFEKVIAQKDEEIEDYRKVLQGTAQALCEKIAKLEAQLTYRSMPKETYSCNDCQRDRDLCPDCHNGSLYLSPDQPDPREQR